MFFKNVFKGRNDWYLYLLTLVFIGLGYIIGQIPMTMSLMGQMERYPDIGSDALIEFQSNPDFSLFYIDANLGFLLILLIFVFATLGLVIGIRFLHRRSIYSLISWSEKIDWKRIFWSFGFWMAIALVAEFIMYLMNPSNYSFHAPGPSFIILLLISLLILPIQTSFEELVFRGYLMQGIGSLFRNKWIALVLTTLLFALVHGMNPEIEEYGLWNMLPYYLVAGLFLAYITIMDNRLELALGVHAATNMFGALFVTYEGAALQTDSLFKTTEVNPLFFSFTFLVFAVIFILIARKRYGWEKTLDVFNKWEEPEFVEDNF